jgi:hypothetical protein
VAIEHFWLTINGQFVANGFALAALQQYRSGSASAEV